MLHETARLKYAPQSTMDQSAATAAGQRTFPPSWLKVHDKDASIAIFTALAILAHLLSRYVWRVGTPDAVPPYFALAVGGIPLIVGLARQAFKLDFGADWLAGISIVTAALLRQYRRFGVLENGCVFRTDPLED